EKVPRPPPPLYGKRGRHPGVAFTLSPVREPRGRDNRGSAAPHRRSEERRVGQGFGKVPCQPPSINNVERAPRFSSRTWVSVRSSSAMMVAGCEGASLRRRARGPVRRRFLGRPHHFTAREGRSQTLVSVCLPRVSRLVMTIGARQRHT